MTLQNPDGTSSRLMMDMELYKGRRSDKRWPHKVPGRKVQRCRSRHEPALPPKYKGGGGRAKRGGTKVDSRLQRR